MKSFFSELYENNGKLVFVLLCFFTLFALVLKKQMLELDTAAFEVLESEGKLGAIKILNSLQYFSIPIFYLIKFTGITFVLWVGAFMFGYKLFFNQIFKIVVLSEFVFVIAELIKIGWILVQGNDVTLFDIQAFYPLSYMQLLDYQDTPNHMWYVYKSINVFELVYWFVLVQFIYAVSNKSLRISTLIVFTSFVPVFLAWLWYFSVVAA